MSTICEQAAIDSAFDRHVDQAFAVVAPRPPLRAIEGDQDTFSAPGPRHPASRALRAAERGHA